MQAAKKRNGVPTRTRRSDAQGSIPPLATADDTALLDALPIAAAVVGQAHDGTLAIGPRPGGGLSVTVSLPSA